MEGSHLQSRDLNISRNPVSFSVVQLASWLTGGGASESPVGAIPGSWKQQAFNLRKRAPKRLLKGKTNKPPVMGKVSPRERGFPNLKEKAFAPLPGFGSDEWDEGSSWPHSLKTNSLRRCSLCLASPPGHRTPMIQGLSSGSGRL